MTACAETISELRQIPGVAGVHVMAVGNEHRIPVILQRAGIGGQEESSPRGGTETGHAG